MTPEDQAMLRGDLLNARERGQRVTLFMDEACNPRRVTGQVDAVAVTNSYVTVGGLHVPTDHITEYVIEGPTG